MPNGDDFPIMGMKCKAIFSQHFKYVHNKRNGIEIDYCNSQTFTIMKNRIQFVQLFLLSVLIVLGASCRKTDPADDIKKETSINDLVIPNNFDFATTNTFELSISDIGENVKYDIYSLSERGIDEIIRGENDTAVVVDDLNQKIASGFVKKGTYVTLITVPSYHKYLYLMRNKNGVFYGKNIEITGSAINYSYTGNGHKDIAAGDDILYAVNGSSTDIRTIDLGTNIVTTIGNLPFKSIANAVDIINQRMYTSSNAAPYEYGYYDLNTNTFTQLGNMPWSFPRMDYNHSDGMLYISQGSNLYKLDPSNAQFLQTYNIVGFGVSGWGDLAFTNNGTLYFSTRDGIYEGTFSGTTVNVVKLSDATMPTYLTSLAAGSNGKLYTTHNSNAQIIEFDPATGTWQYVSISQNVTINDFGMLRAVPPITDTDGDGVPDDQDDYPTDPDRAFNNYFPGENTWATLAYEDLWPSKGDYDFNDLVVGYNINQVTNADNNVVDIRSKWDVRHNGAGLNNGFAFEIGVDASDVASVTGYNHTSQHIPMNPNGTEAGQTKANFVVFDETVPNLGQTLELYVLLNAPISPITVGSPPYNPYVIVNGDTDVEVHLPDCAPTELADVSLFGTLDDDSDPATGRYYKTSTNLPWAINIVYDFVWMKEKQEITLGYLKFDEWAQSGGTEYQDWYKDLPGYRNDSYLDYQ